MSLPVIRAAIHTRLRTISGVRVVIGGMPNTIQVAPPLFITQFQSAQRIGQTNKFNWRFTLHAVIENQVNDLAESAIDTMAEATIQAFSPRLNDSDGRNRARLGGAAESCFFESAESGDTDGYITFGSGDGAKTYRRIGFVLVVVTLEAY